MKCDRVETVGGKLMVFAARRQSSGYCEVCDALATHVCDFPIGPGEKKCDRALCATDAAEVGANLHFCPQHVEMNTAAAAQGVLNLTPAGGER